MDPVFSIISTARSRQSLFWKNESLFIFKNPHIELINFLIRWLWMSTGIEIAFKTRASKSRYRRHF
jgi:hypothetical protein